MKTQAESEYINLLGCYAVPHGNKIYAETQITRNELRTQLFHTMKKILQPVKHITRVNGGFKGLGKRFIGNILVGDLQETITTTSRDNLKSVKYKWHKHSVMNAIAEAVRSI